MKAVVLYKHGGVEELKYEEYPEPKPTNDKVLVRVRACSLNHLDIWVRKGIPNVKINFPHIPGSDIAGELLTDTEQLKKGSRVLIYPGLSCMRCKYCIEGNENLCKDFTIIGGLNDTQGGYAEFIVVPKHNILPIPDNFTYEEAACINISYLTAWNMLKCINAKRGDTIMVYSAGSGVGVATIQFAKSLGCKVITTVGDSSKIEKAKSLNPDLIIDLSKEDILTKVKGFEIDGVIDHVGKDTLNISLQALRIGGRLAVCGATSGDITDINIRMLYNKRLTMYGVYLGSKNQLLEMLKFMKEHNIKPIIDSIIPLENVREAHTKMENRRHFGKIVLTVN